MLKTYEEVKLAWQQEGKGKPLDEYVRDALIPCYDEECNFEGYLKRSDLAKPSNDTLH